MPRLLSDSEITGRLAGLDGWTHRGRFITKKFVFPTFLEGVDFIRRVASVAEKEEHHPDIRVRYTEVTLSVQTHSEGGVTSWDIGLARAIENELARKDGGLMKASHSAKRI